MANSNTSLMTLDIKGCELIEVPKLSDLRGSLSFIEKDAIPFEIKRIFYMYHVPTKSSRGEHAHRIQESFIVALHGSFDVELDSGESKQTVTLNEPHQGVYVPKLIWNSLHNFSENAVCLVLASTEYEEAEYIRDYKEFKSIVSRGI